MVDRHGDPSIFSSRHRGQLGLAKVAIFWESLWPSLWPPLGVAGVFLTLAFFDLLPLLPGWLHGIVLGAFACLFVLAAWRGARRVHMPSLEAARRRTERASGLRHRPLESLGDRLAAGRDDATSEALWRAHRARMEAAVSTLKVGLPRPGLPRRDPMALRAALILVFAVAAIAAWGDAGNRLRRAALPDITHFAETSPPSLDVWITPPDYTEIAPIFLARAGKAGERQDDVALPVPAGSKVLARVSGGLGRPQLAIGPRSVAFDAVDGESFHAEALVEAADGTAERLAVSQGGRELAAWPIRIVPDRPPTIEFFNAPQRTQRSALRLEYLAEDDYGLAKAEATIRRPDGAEDNAVTIELPIPGVRPRTAQDASYHDLTPHPWAGLPVTIQFRATDGSAQTGESETFEMILPERIFNHPVARAIVKERQRLTLDPSNRGIVAAALAGIASRPEHFYDDIVVFLSLVTARKRLFHDQGETVIAEVQQLLWDTALRVEDGELSLAERDLRELQDALREALDRGAPDDELERLIDELQAAMERYLEALAEELAKRPPSDLEMDSMLNDPDALTLEAQDLRRMLEQMREMARTGARDAARQMLSQLQEILENLRAARPFDRAGRSGMAMQMLRNLEEVMRGQQDLLQRTFRDSQAMRPGGEPRPGSRGSARDQEALRRMLGEIMRRFGESMGEIPAPLGRAERAMRDAREALRRQAPGEAMDPQSRALDELRQGRSAMIEQFREQMGQGQGESAGRGEGKGERDPLGRRNSGFAAVDGDDVTIPEEADLQRARQILDELRRRAGQRSRPRLELDYIDRLLRRF